MSDVVEDVLGDPQGSSARDLHSFFLSPALPTGMHTDCHEFGGL